MKYLKKIVKKNLLKLEPLICLDSTLGRFVAPFLFARCSKMVTLVKYERMKYFHKKRLSKKKKLFFTNSDYTFFKTRKKVCIFEQKKKTGQKT